MTRILHISEAIFLIFMICACSQETIVTVGTGNTAGNYDRTGLDLARAVNKDHKSHGYQLQVKTSAGSVANIDAVLAGDMAFGIAQADRQYQAVNGLADWKSKGPQKELRAVFSLYTESVTLVAGRNAGITTIYDLKGKRVDIGPSGSGIRQNAIDALQAAGIDWQKDIDARQEDWDNRVPMLMHGDIDALFHTVGHPSRDISIITASKREMRFVPLVNIESLLTRYPYYAKTTIRTKEWYPLAANDKDVETVGVRAILVTSAKVPSDVVYAITKAVFDNLSSLGESAPILKTLSKEHMLEGLVAPIHPGALKYYRESGLQIPPSKR